VAIRRQQLLVCFAIWLPAGVIGLVVKYFFLHGQGFAAIASTLPNGTLSLLQELTFFRSDLLLMVVGMPLVLFLIRSVLPSRRGFLVAASITVLALLIESAAFVQLKLMGHIVRWSVLAEGVSWALAHPRQLSAYIAMDARLLLKVLVAAGVAAVGFVVCWRWLKRRSAKVRHWGFRMAAVAWILGTVLAVVSLAGHIDRTKYHSGLIPLTIDASFESDTVGGAYAGLPVERLRREYEQLANAPRPRSPRPYWGAAKDYDVVMVVMETGPASYLLTDPTFSEYPNLHRLAQQSWVGMHHYTPAPESVRAVLPLLCSFYPPKYNKNLLGQKERIPGTMSALGKSGYRTGFYLPGAYGEAWSRQERNMFEKFQADRVFMPGVMLPGNSQGAEEYDLRAMREMEKDFTAAAAAGKRFAGAYLPQLAHEPWGDLSAAGNVTDMGERRRNIMKVEDRHLGELLEVIEATGRLNRTLIVVSFDHGLRTALSDPAFREGYIDDRTFHVPLVFYAPEIVKTQTNLAWTTSHLDIGPSLLDLLGIADGREFEMGSPLWDERLSQRRIFFWATAYFGAAGYADGNSFSMWSEMLDVPYRNTELHFDWSSAVPKASAVHTEIMQRVDRVSQLRDAWYQAALRAGAAR
jgi:membrane-anchored protein YejM (alkaline phosphatase superfamily)